MSGLEEISVRLSGPVLLAALVGFGFLVGILTGLFGVGGGFLIVPMLRLLFGIDWPVAVGSSLAFTIGAGASGTARHMRLRNVEPRSAAILAAAAGVGAVLGAMLLESLKARLGRGGPARFDVAMHGLFVVMLAVTAYLLYRRAEAERTRPALLQRVPFRPRIALPHADLEDVSLPGLVLLGVGVGVLTGLMGIGGGVLYMPILILVVGLTPHQAVGTSLAVVLFGSVAGTIKHGLAGNVNLVLTMALLVGSSVGIQAGAWLCDRLHGSRLRRWFAALVAATAVVLAADLARKLAAS